MRRVEGQGQSLVVPPTAACTILRGLQLVVGGSVKR